MQIPLKIYTFDDSSMQHILQIRVFFESSHRFVDVSLYELTGQESISFKHTIHLFQSKKEKKKSKNTENYSSKVTRKITRDHSKLRDTSHANKKKGRNVKEGGKKKEKRKK